MTEKRYPDLRGESLEEIVAWVKEVTRTREEDIGNADAQRNKITAAADVTYDNDASGMTAENVQDALDELDTAVASAVPSGVISAYGGTAAPTGWLLCYGQAISRTTYAALFTAISTTYGVGDGSTTFNVPDIRGRVIAGQDDMGGSSANRLTAAGSGLDGDVLGGTGGLETHTLTTAQIPLHGHPYRLSTNAGAGADATGGFMMDNGGAGPSNQAAYTGALDNTAGHQIGGEGGDGAHNNVQPTIIINYIIKT